MHERGLAQFQPTYIQGSLRGKESLIHDDMEYIGHEGTY